MDTVCSLHQLKRTDLLLAGGKGANLGALIEAGLPVPDGFCLTTAAYRWFIANNQLEASIQQHLVGIHPDDPLELEAASEAIRRLFEAGTIPAELAAEICAAYRPLSHEAGLNGTSGAGAAVAVAVRSSATAEDLPDLSFAGQQDTYLNIIGEEALLHAVVRCWASLWTSRAIAYRARNHIDPSDIALAVVVQQMVPSEVSGVLFTANPLTGRRCETVIDAAFGLGEALVSGMVEPDHYIVECAGDTGARILQKDLGGKALSVRGAAGGGTQVLPEDAAAFQALPDAQILALARLGAVAERFFGAPQDMEWAWAASRLYVLQSRAITSLYPLPESVNDESFEVLFSFASWQGMLSPISPLGQDTFMGMAASVARHFGSGVVARDQRLLLPAGDRLFVNITSLMRSPIGRKIAGRFIASVDPVSDAILAELLQDPRLSLRTQKIPMGVLGSLVPLIGNVIYNLLWPAPGRIRLEQQINRAIEETRKRCAQAPNFAALLQVLEQTPLSGPSLLSHLLPGVMSGQIPLQIMLRLAADLEGGPALALELTRGLPHNVTTQMDLKLWAISRAIQADAQSAWHFQASSAEALSAEYLAGHLPAVAQRAVADFLYSYGMRGVAEIDIYRPRWKEDPLHIFQVLKSYLEMNDAVTSPEAVFQKSTEKTRQAGRALISALRRTRYGAFKAVLARFLIGRIYELAGLRETPKFTIVRLLDGFRDELLAAGRRLVEAGALTDRHDIFFLHIWELRQFVDGALPDAPARIEQRRNSYLREMERRRVPRILVSDGTSYYDGYLSSLPGSGHPAESEDEGILTGNPVSAGVVEGTVRVLYDPRGVRLLPGEILVCPATDPAWTPLFLAAGGLVMEVGGMITHGSVVAREYGIPAVVGVRDATTRLKTGQRVRVDGAVGRVQVLEEAPAEPQPARPGKKGL
jgi:pyruvate,water dikinase